jgi:O-antigen ligase
VGALFFIVVTVVYLAYATRGPAHAMAATAALMPFNQYVPSGFLPGVNIASIALALALWSISQSAKNEKLSFPKVLPLFGVVLTLGYVHSMFAELPPHYAYLYDSWFVFIKFKEWMTTLILCYAGFRAATSVEAAERIVMGGVAGFGAETVFCFLEYLTHSGRVTGHLEEANSTGAFLATYAAFSLGVYMAWKGDKRRWIFLALGVMGAIATTGTRSRGGFLALGASFLLTAFAKNRLIAILVLVMAVTYQAWMPEALLARFDTAYKVDDTGHVEAADTAASRIEIWKAGFRTIPDYPFGLGFGLYAYFVPSYGLEEIMARPFKNAHNDYVLMAVEFSLVGGAIYILFLLTFLSRAWKTSRRDPDPGMRALGSGVFGGMVGAMAATIAVSLMLRLDFGGVLWVLVGVAARRAAEITDLAPAKPSPVKAAPVVASR